MSDILRNGNASMAAETGTVREGNSALTDLVMDGLNVQLSPLSQDGAKGTADVRTMAYRDRILEAVGR